MKLFLFLLFLSLDSWPLWYQLSLRGPRASDQEDGWPLLPRSALWAGLQLLPHCQEGLPLWPGHAVCCWSAGETHTTVMCLRLAPQIETLALFLWVIRVILSELACCLCLYRRWLLSLLFCRAEDPGRTQHTTWTRPFRPTETCASKNKHSLAFVTASLIHVELFSSHPHLYTIW